MRSSRTRLARGSTHAILEGALLVTLLVASTARAEPGFDPRERAVFLAPGWRPLASAGYRLQLIRERLPSGAETRSAHGFTVDVLVPLLASGSQGSRTRVAFALGAGADFGLGRYDRSRISTDGVHQVGHYDEQTTYLHGQIGVIVRSKLTDRVAFVATLAWQPGARLLRIGTPGVVYIGAGFVTGPPPYGEVRRWDASLTRGRLSLAIHRHALRLGVFVGATFRDDEPFFTRRQELDLGAQIGVGW